MTIVRPVLIVLTRRDWSGTEHLPPQNGFVLATNHLSEFDPLPLAHFVYDGGRVPRFLGKIEVFAVPVLGWILRSAGQIPVYRRSADASKAYDAAVAAVRAGECVIVYPEGTISRDPGLWPMVGKTGAARIALSTECPVIPCAMWGPNEVLAPYSRRPRVLPRKVMHVRAGKPVELTDLARLPLTTDVLHEATSRVMDAITVLLEDIRGTRAPDVRFDPKAQGVPETGNPNDPRNKSAVRPCLREGHESEQAHDGGEPA
ncbi:MAG: lysophospholipid acyltransferase family protein [Nocardioidaceae bacterium]